MGKCGVCYRRESARNSYFFYPKKGFFEDFARVFGVQALKFFSLPIGTVCSQTGLSTLKNPISSEQLTKNNTFFGKAHTRSFFEGLFLKHIENHTCYLFFHIDQKQKQLNNSKYVKSLP